MYICKPSPLIDIIRLSMVLKATNPFLENLHEANEAILAGRVKVDGKIIKNPEYTVSSCVVQVDNTAIQIEFDLVYYTANLLSNRNFSFDTCVFVAICQWQKYGPHDKQHEFRGFFQLVTDKLTIKSLETFENSRESVEKARLEYHGL